MVIFFLFEYISLGKWQWQPTGFVNIRYCLLYPCRNLKEKFISLSVFHTLSNITITQISLIMNGIFVKASVGRQRECHLNPNKKTKIKKKKWGSTATTNVFLYKLRTNPASVKVDISTCRLVGGMMPLHNLQWHHFQISSPAVSLFGKKSKPYGLVLIPCPVN